MSNKKVKITFEQFVEDYYMGDTLPPEYDIFPRDGTTRTSSEWSHVIIVFNKAIGEKYENWRIIDLNFRQVFPELIATDLVGVQPMTEPVGQIFYAKYGISK